MEGHGWSVPITGLTFQLRKVMVGWGGGGVGWPVGLYVVSAPVPVPVLFLWTLDLGIETWIWVLDLGPGFGNWILDWTWA